MTNIKTVSTEANRGIGFLQVLFVTFLVLKLTGVIGWSWWWVAAPLWVPWAIIGFFLVMLAALKIAIWRGEKKLKRLRAQKRKGVLDAERRSKL